VAAIRRFSNHRSELLEQQSKNGLALALVQRRLWASSWKTAHAVRPLRQRRER